MPSTLIFHKRDETFQAQRIADNVRNKESPADGQRGLPGGEDEIRTRGRMDILRQFSKLVVSATHPPLLDGNRNPTEWNSDAFSGAKVVCFSVSAKFLRIFKN